MVEKHTGWCLIPPGIFSSTDISQSQKMLIGRIISLVNNDGYCFASNKWFGGQLGLTKGQAANIIMDLHRRGYLKIELIRNENNRIIERRIYPVYENIPIQEKLNTYSGKTEYPIQEKLNTPIQENLKGSITVDISITERDKNTSQASKSFDDALKLSRLLYSEILINETSTRIPHITDEKNIEKIIQTWAKDIDKLIRIDRQDPSIVEEVIRWTQQDGFWGPNVLSGKKLREKWDALVARKNQRVSTSRQAASMQKNKETKEDELYARRLTLMAPVHRGCSKA